MRGIPWYTIVRRTLWTVFKDLRPLCHELCHGTSLRGSKFAALFSWGNNKLSRKEALFMTRSDLEKLTSRIEERERDRWVLHSGAAQHQFSLPTINQIGRGVV